MRNPLHSAIKFLGCASLLAVFAASAPTLAQQGPPPAPYASLGTNGVSYAGPGREPSYDLRGPTIHIGLLAPLKGPQKAAGEAIVRAAKMALQDVARQPLPGGLHLALAIGDESGPAWGPVTNAMLHLVFNDHVVAIVTSASGATAHLCEQVGNKIGVPVLTLSSDVTTTQINLPWIFRLGPSDAQQAQAIARDIYRTRGFKRVLLVAERDHDGRMGGRQFVEAASRLGAPAPDSMAINPLSPDAGSLLSAISTKSPQAIVFWTQPENTKILLDAIRAKGLHAPVYLSQEAAQQDSEPERPSQKTAGIKGPSGVGTYTVALEADGAALRADFTRRYQAVTGMYPSPVVAEAYDAVWLVARAVRASGPNRARVRDRLSKTRDLNGVSGTITFDDQGNNLAKVGLLRLR